MASINKVKSSYTFEGAKASKIPQLEQLKRTVMSCLLWENNFYEDGESVSDRIIDLTTKCGYYAIQVMLDAKFESKLRHTPLLMAAVLAKESKIDAVTLSKLFTRVDDMTEFLAIYWRDGKCPLSRQVKMGLTFAVKKFDEYQFAKYDRDGVVKIRDIFRLVHPKAESKEQGELWGRVVRRELKTPDTWEVALSSGADKKTTFERLLSENNLGDLAYLRNMRNMLEAKVDRELLRSSCQSRSWNKILPFQFISAAKYAPNMIDVLEEAMLKSLGTFEMYNGRVAILVDISGSMRELISEKSDNTRLDVASGVAMMARELFSDVSIFRFNTSAEELPAYHGFALRKEFGPANGGTQMIDALNQVCNGTKFDAVVVITDEQTSPGVIQDNKTNIYIVNVGTSDKGVMYHNNVVHVNGWSENVVKFVVQDLNSKKISGWHMEYRP